MSKYYRSMLIVVLVAPLATHAGGQTAEAECLLVSESTQVLRLSLSGESDRFLERSGSIEALGSEVYLLRGEEAPVYDTSGKQIRSLWRGEVSVYDTGGKELRSISIPPEVSYSVGFTVLPDKRLALLDNRHDTIYFIDPNGKHLKTVPLAEEPDKLLQNMGAVTVRNKLVVSENGHSELIAVDLTTYEASVFRDLKKLQGGLGAITYSDDRYYICQSRSIYSFAENSEDLKEVAETPEGNITGMVACEGRLFAVVNGMSLIKERSLSAKRATSQGVLYEISLTTGDIKLIKNGLNYPQGLVLY